jgi:hypothetical protein
MNLPSFKHSLPGARREPVPGFSLPAAGSFELLGCAAVWKTDGKLLIRKASFNDHLEKMLC